MRRPIRKRFKNSSLMLVLLLVFLFYFEFFCYYLNSFNWHRIKCDKEELCTKIILVADPQLIGKQNEVIHFVTPLSIWDSDRYLRITYQHAFNFVKPDIVIFLGDLFDEGSISSELEFQSYVTRLHNIFSANNENSAIQYIWIPGDNDIGGEGMDIVTARKIAKFNRAFPQPDIVQLKNITFYRINRLLQYIPNTTDNNDFFDVNIIKIGISHIPILNRQSAFRKEVLEKLQPHLLFTAHEHKSKIIQIDFKDPKTTQIITVDRKQSKKFSYEFGINYVYEFLIPTCSYRMGTFDMGYGFAIIENDYIQYTVLWSPTRFPTLIFYISVLISIIFVLFMKMCCKIICCRIR